MLRPAKRLRSTPAGRLIAAISVRQTWFGHAEQLEPERAELRQDAALVGNARRHHPVERADPVGRHQEQPVAQVIDIADLAAANGYTGQVGFKESGHGGSRGSGFSVQGSGFRGRTYLSLL